MPTTMYVTNEGTAHDTFDRSYSLNEHFDLVREAWGRYGLLRGHVRTVS